VLALYGAGIAAALVVYQPWRPTQFSITDFSEFLRLLEQHRTLGSRISAFVGYYASQGRFNLIPYVYLVLEWTTFGWNPAAWQISRFIEMCGIVALVYVLLHRLTGSRPGAIAGASLFIFASCAAQAWIRLTMAEPLAMWFLLAGALLATRYQTTVRWRWSGATIAILVALVVLTKEVLIALIPFIVLLAWTRDAHGQFVRPRALQRNRWLALSTIVATTVALIPVAVIALRANGSAFAAAYGHTPLSVVTAIERFMTLVLPGFATYPPHVNFMVLANVLFLLLVGAGWSIQVPDVRYRRSFRAVGACLVAISFAGVAVYLPWPFFNFFYGLPFLLAPSALLAFAFHFLEQRWPRNRLLVYITFAILLTQLASFAGYDARNAFAQRDANGKLIVELGRLSVGQLSAEDSVVLATYASRILPWAGTGPTLSRFASAVFPERQMPTIREVPCDSIRAAAEDNSLRRVIVLSYSDDCGSFTSPSWSTRRIFSYVYWPSVTLRSDSVRVDMLLPSKLR